MILSPEQLEPFKAILKKVYYAVSTIRASLTQPILCHQLSPDRLDEPEYLAKSVDRVLDAVVVTVKKEGIAATIAAGPFKASAHDPSRIPHFSVWLQHVNTVAPVFLRFLAMFIDSKLTESWHMTKNNSVRPTILVVDVLYFF